MHLHHVLAALLPLVASAADTHKCTPGEFGPQESTLPGQWNLIATSPDKLHPPQPVTVNYNGAVRVGKHSDSFFFSASISGGRYYDHTFSIAEPAAVNIDGVWGNSVGNVWNAGDNPIDGVRKTPLLVRAVDSCIDGVAYKSLVIDVEGMGIVEVPGDPEGTARFCVGPRYDLIVTGGAEWHSRIPDKCTTVQLSLVPAAAGAGMPCVFENIDGEMHDSHPDHGGCK